MSARPGARGWLLAASIAGCLAHAACGDDDLVEPRYDAGAGPTLGCDAARAEGACTHDADCAVGTACIADPASRGLTDLAPAVLACGALGGGGDVGAECASAADCARGLCVVAGTCVAPCARDDDCDADARCAAVYVRGEPGALHPTSACVPRVHAPGGVTAAHARVERLFGPSGRGELALDAFGARGLAVIVPDCEVDALGIGLTTRDAAPTTLFDYGAWTEAGKQPNPIADRVRPITVLVPMAPRGITSEAGYLLTLQSTGEGGADVVSMTRRAPGTTLDVDVYYAGGGDWASEGERGPPDVVRVLGYLEGVLATFGVALGDVRQHDVSGGLRSRFSVVRTGLRPGEENELGPLFALTAGQARASLPLFFVRTIDGAIGRSGGVPGPAGVDGTAGSGVAVGVDLVGSLSIVERAVAHEVGHYLGLFHTSEMTGHVHDPLEDTPECGPDRDADGDGVVLAEECAGAGAENLMFWSAGGEALTSDQRAIAGAALVLR